MPSNEYLNLAMETYELVFFFKQIYGLGKTSNSSKYLYAIYEFKFKNSFYYSVLPLPYSLY